MILDAVHTTNEFQKVKLVEMAREHFGSLKGKTIAIWGLAFKPKDRRHAGCSVDCHHQRPEAARGRDHGIRSCSCAKRWICQAGGESLRGCKRRRRPDDRHGVE